MAKWQPYTCLTPGRNGNPCTCLQMATLVHAYKWQLLYMPTNGNSCTRLNGNPCACLNCGNPGTQTVATLVHAYKWQLLYMPTNGNSCEHAYKWQPLFMPTNGNPCSCLQMATLVHAYKWQLLYTPKWQPLCMPQLWQPWYTNSGNPCTCL